MRLLTDSPVGLGLFTCAFRPASGLDRVPCPCAQGRPLCRAADAALKTPSVQGCAEPWRVGVRCEQRYRE